MSEGIAAFMTRAAQQTGFMRESYVEDDLPTSYSSLTILPFFGDFRSQFVLSTLLLHRYLGEARPHRYFILCSWPGLSGLFPYVDEYWSPQDNGVLENLWDHTSGFENTSTHAETFARSLRQRFDDVITFNPDLSKYYADGLTKPFFDEFGKVTVALPGLRSLRVDLSRLLAQRAGYKVFVHPSRVARGWEHGSYIVKKVDRAFWNDLLTALCQAGMTPVVWQNYGTYDLSENQQRCVFVQEQNVLDVLAVMRGCSCVLDVCGGLNRYAAVARCPFLGVEHRSKFVGLKEYELDDLAVLNKSYRYIFSFPTILEGVGKWSSLIDNIVVKLNEMLPGLNRDTWPTTSEYVSTVSYSQVRKLKTKRLGTKFIKVPQD